MAGGKNFLFVPNLSTGGGFQNHADEIVNAFMKKAFLTDSVLYFVIDADADAYNYFRRITRRAFFGSCKMQLLLRNQTNMEELIKQMDFYIVGNHPDEAYFLDAAFRNDVEVMGLIERADDIFATVQISEQVNDLKQQIDAAVTDMFEKFPQRQYEYFLCHEGLGETMAFFFWLKEYHKLTSKKILTVSVNPLRFEMMQSCPYVDMAVKVDAPIYDYLSIYHGTKNLLSAHFSEKTLQQQKNLPAHLSHTYGIPQKIRDFLGISPSVKFQPYEINLPQESIDKAKKVFAEMNFTEGKTVFVVVEGLAVGGLQHHNEFWVKLSQVLKSKGYSVVTSGPNEAVADCPNIMLSLFESVAFAGLCGHIVSCPTGFVEACCTFNRATPMTLQVIWPGKNDDYYKRSGIMGRIVGLESLRYFGGRFADNAVLGHIHHVKQYIGENTKLAVHSWGDTAEDDDALIEKILKHILEVM